MAPREKKESPNADFAAQPGGADGESGADESELGAEPGLDGAPDSSSSAQPTPTATDDSELQAQRDKYLRLAAEFDNYRRRSVKERQEAGARAQADLTRNLLDALDDLSRFAHVDPTTVDTATVVQGAEMVERKLMKALSAVGLEVVNPINSSFDPALHEAVATEPAASREDDHVVARVYQPGYIFGGLLLRPARVVVRQWNG